MQFLAKVALLNAQNRRLGLGPAETSISGANHDVLHAQSDRSYLGPIKTCYSGPKDDFCMQKPVMNAGAHGD